MVTRKYSTAPIGRFFGRWKVLGYSHRGNPYPSNPHGLDYWLVRCKCGTEKSVIARSIALEITISCGCYATECKRKRIKHGMSRSAEYGVWEGMLARCANPKLRAYKNYGGRGISVTPEWKEFAVFFRDMGRRPSDRHTLERVNNNGNYEPNNCTWATRQQQSLNTRRSVIIEYQGTLHTVRDWERVLGFERNFIQYRLHLGMSFEQAILTPRRTRALCSICGKPANAHKLCSTHYAQQRRKESSDNVARRCTKCGGKS